jgi:3-hydroxyisobutyrate dehydrogenase-like beta-hydroxyacid dehydrogenase
MTENKATIGFVGLGIMGFPMATHLLQAGYHLRVSTGLRPKQAPLSEAGAVVCSPPLRRLGADFVITS